MASGVKKTTKKAIKPLTKVNSFIGGIALRMTIEGYELKFSDGGSFSKAIRGCKNELYHYACGDLPPNGGPVRVNFVMPAGKAEFKNKIGQSAGGALAVSNTRDDGVWTFMAVGNIATNGIVGVMMHNGQFYAGHYWNNAERLFENLERDYAINLKAITVVKNLN